MSFVNKFLNSMKLNDDDYDGDEFEPDEDLDLDYSEEPKEKTRKQTSRPVYESELALDDDEPYEEEEEEKKSFFKSRKPAPQPSVVPMKNKSNMEVCMIKPSVINDSREIIDVLLSGRAVVINMEGLNLDVAQRIVDFASGACYSMNGNLQSISKYIFIITPNNIELSGDFSGGFSGNDDISVNM